MSAYRNRKLMGTNTTFTRTLLALVMPDVKANTTIEQRKSTWTYNFGRNHWEFHGPDGFYWHGSADNAYDARYNGWCRYLGEVIKHPDYIITEEPSK